MRNFSRGKNTKSQRGAVSASYVIGLVLIAAVLIGGVLFLKNLNSKPDSSDSNGDETVVVESNENSESEEGKVTTSEDSSPAQSTVAQAGATGEYAPEEISAAGAEDFVATMAGLIFVLATIYMAWNYRQSRRAVAAALLKK